MPYEPTIWETGDVITAEKLNKIEQAIYALYGGGGGDVPAGYVVVAPEQEVTVTDSPVTVTLATGQELPEILPTNWIVKFDDETAEFNTTMWGYFVSVDDSTTKIMAYDNGNLVAGILNSSQQIVPGNFTVVAYGPDYTDTIPSGFVSIAPKQGATVKNGDAILTIADGYTLPDTLPQNWVVTTNNYILEYNISEGSYFYTDNDSNIYYVTLDTTSDELCFGAYDNNSDPIPGTYTVAIYAPEDSGGEQ